MRYSDILIMPYENNLERNSVLSASVAKDRIITKFPQVNPLPLYNSIRTLYFSYRLKICKAVLVGDVAVGKSCLVNRFCHDVFNRDYKATIGVDFEVEKFSILSIPFNLQIWDTAGQERFKCIAASYYRGSNVVIVVFDMSDISSLTGVTQWKEDACQNASDPLVFLVGTKKDLLTDTSYGTVEKEAIAIAHEINAEFWAVSSKTGENVKEFFFRVVALTFDDAIQREAESMKTRAKQIGNDFIRIERKQDLYDKKESGFSKCC
ncbi:hypothetical protein LSH36_288g02047 [Paralvinella palmiformis]|uniref:Ras-related protein Rab-36 n=1 Tax=Paralvinella palmiformis TaxID=53620 RepID=A0AAD9JIP4_9ANNE|nr:hypothetical protein LSH36_288g02047 [Paralvinella palmiformis]